MTVVRRWLSGITVLVVARWGIAMVPGSAALNERHYRWPGDSSVGTPIRMQRGRLLRIGRRLLVGRVGLICCRVSERFVGGTVDVATSLIQISALARMTRRRGGF